MAAERWRAIVAYSPRNGITPLVSALPTFEQNEIPPPISTLFTFEQNEIPPPISTLSTFEQDEIAHKKGKFEALDSTIVKKEQSPTPSNLKDLFANRKDLDDCLIDECIHLMIKQFERSDILYISSINLAVPIFRQDSDSIVRHFGSKQPNWKYMITPINKRPFPPSILPVSTHWSLLIISKRNPLLYIGYHYDSSVSQMNEPDAIHLCKILSAGLLSDGPEMDSFAPFRVPFYTQPGGFECGFYVVLGVYLFLKYGLRGAHAIYNKNKLGFNTHFDEMCTFIK